MHRGNTEMAHPQKDKAQEALLFEDLTFLQDTFEKDKKGRKQPVPEGKRDFISSKEKVSKSDLELLKLGLQNANSPCQLAEILQDTNCEPCEFNVNIQAENNKCRGSGCQT